MSINLFFACSANFGVRIIFSCACFPRYLREINNKRSELKKVQIELAVDLFSVSYSIFEPQSHITIFASRGADSFE